MLKGGEKSGRKAEAPISAALIGLGRIAWKYDARRPEAPFALSQAGAMLRQAGLRLAGGCSPDADDRAAFAAWSGGRPVFADPAEMLDSLRPELVGVCSPTDLHFEHARLCLEAGVRRLWLEKPATETADQLETLIRLAREKRAAVCVNFFRRYLSVYRELRRMLRQKELGDCRLLRVLYSPGLARNGVHLLDQLFFLTGAEGFELLWVERGGDPANPSFALRLSTGHLASVCGADLSYHSNDISAVCAEGVVSVLGGGKRARVERRVENAMFSGFYELAEADHPMAREASVDDYLSPALDDLLQSAAAGREPQSGLAAALSTQRLLERVLREAAS
jgi:predicted dehydrogenase